MFGVEFEAFPDKGQPNFLLEWARFERWIRYIAFYFAKPGKNGVTRVLFQNPRYLIEKYLPIKLNKSWVEKLNTLQKTRNLAVHGLANLDKSTNDKALKELKSLWAEFNGFLKEAKIDVQKAQREFERHLREISRFRFLKSTKVFRHFLGHNRLTTTESYLNLSSEDTIREFLNKW